MATDDDFPERVTAAEVLDVLGRLGYRWDVDKRPLNERPASATTFDSAPEPIQTCLLPQLDVFEHASREALSLIVMPTEDQQGVRYERFVRSGNPWLIERVKTPDLFRREACVAGEGNHPYLGEVIHSGSIPLVGPYARMELRHTWERLRGVDLQPYERLTSLE